MSMPALVDRLDTGEPVVWLEWQGGGSAEEGARGVGLHGIGGKGGAGLGASEQATIQPFDACDDVHSQSFCRNEMWPVSGKRMR